MSLSKEKRVHDWKKYEWLVSKLLHDDFNSVKLKVQYDQRVRGKISQGLRQCDILITNRQTEELILVDAKHRKNKVDIKVVEEFEGLCKDVGASLGLIISSKGFTKGAKRRVKGMTNIFPIEVDWQRAYEALEGVFLPNYIPKVCPECGNDEVNINFPSLILWDTPFGKIRNGIIYQFWIGECLLCKRKYLYCDSCGEVSMIKGKNIICKNCKEKYGCVEKLP